MPTIISINAQNAGYFSELAYRSPGTGMVDAAHGLSAASFPGWTEISSINNKLLSSYFADNHIQIANGIFENQFRIFTNGSQYVFAFKGSTVPSNFVDDLVHDGGEAYGQLAPVVASAVAYVKSLNPAAQIIMDGHSLGGGLAQTFALVNQVNGFGQNSLPISLEARDTITNFTGKLASYRLADQFVETNTDGDIASLTYSTGLGQTYLDLSPTTLPSSYSTQGEIILAASGFLAGPVPGAATLLAAVTSGGLAHLIGLNVNLSQQYVVDGSSGHLVVPAASTPPLAAFQISRSPSGSLVVSDALGDQLIVQTNAQGTVGMTLSTPTGGEVDATGAIDPITGATSEQAIAPGLTLLRSFYDANGNLTSTNYRANDGGTGSVQIDSSGNVTELLSEGVGSDTFNVVIPAGPSVIATIQAGPGTGSIVVYDPSGTPTVLGAGLIVSGSYAWTDIDHTLYTYSGQPGSQVGTLTISGGSLIGNPVNSIIITNFNLSISESNPNGFLGLRLPETLTLNAGALVDKTATVSTFLAGSTRAFTVSVDSPSNFAQSVMLTLSGADPADFELEAGSVSVPLNGSVFYVQIAAGETSATFTLGDKSPDDGNGDVASGGSLQLTAQALNPSNPALSPIQSGSVAINYLSRDPDVGVAPKNLNNINGNYSASTGVTTYLSDGRDDLIIATGSSNLVNASHSANDSIVGGTGSNTIYGGSGDVVITLNGTADGVGLGNGFNTLTGSATGRDTVYGNGGDALIVANGGTDLIIAAQGNNEIYAGSKTTLADAISAALTATPTHVQGDLLSVLDGNNTIVGGLGDDLVIAGSGSDIVVLGPGNDTFVGGWETSDALSNWTAVVTPPATLSGDSDLEVSNVNVSVPNFTNPYSQPYNGSVHADSGLPDAGVANDTVYAGRGNDYIVLGNGNNLVQGGSGSDTIFGGMGNDSIIVGSGATLVHGGGGKTFIQGGSGTDTIFGGDGDNTIFGGSGNSTLVSANGPTAIYANAGLELNYVNGGAGNDVIYGSAGHDTLIAGTGNTTIYGQSGTEYIVGGSGNDQLIAGDGNATLIAGGAGHDTLQGGTNASSSYVIYGGDGTDSINGGSGTDTLFAGDGGVAGAATSVLGSIADTLGHTTIFGGLGVDALQGGVGATVIYGGDGGSAAAPTTVKAGSGPTTIYGGLGTELIGGGSGVDIIYAGDGGVASAVTTVIAGSGLATIYGGAGNASLQDTVSGQDLLIAGSGDQSMIGIGTDTLVAGSGNDVMQNNGGSLTIGLNEGFGSVALISSVSGGVDNLAFGSGMSPSDFLGNVAIDQFGNAELVLTGDGGSITIQGGLTGSLGTLTFADSGSISAQTYLSEAFPGPQTFNFGTPSFPEIVLLTMANNALASVGLNGAGGDTVSSWGSGSTLQGGSNSSLYGTSLYAAGANDLITGSTVNGRDTINASGNNDTVVASKAVLEQITVTGSNVLVTASSGGYDTIKALGVADTVNGGGSNEQIYIANASSVVNVGAGATDTLYSSVSYTAPVNINTLVLNGTANISGTGNTGTNTLVGGMGQDTLIAGSGLATLVGGTGNTTFVINNVLDVVQDTSSSASNTLRSSVNATLVANVNALVLTGTANLVGTANSGTDTLTSNSGVDTLVGGSGGDTFVIGNSGDVIQDTASAANNVALASVNYVLPANVGTLILTGTSALMGTGSGGNDTLVSNSGVDTLVGGAGIDVFIVNNASDVLVNVGANDVVQYAAGLTLPSGVNSIVLTGTASLSVTGNAASDIIVANSGADTLTAGAGVATLVGGAGNDVFVVNNLADIVQNTFTTTSDTIKSSVNFTLPTNVNSLVLTGTAGLKGTANAANDTLTSNTGIDTLVGGSGNDTFVIGNSADVVQDTSTSASNAALSSVSYVLPVNVNSLTLTGTQSLVGTTNSGNDLIVGNAGSDTLIATSGVDTLIAGSGVATLSGGTGNDLFVVNSALDVVSVGGAHGADTIMSSATYVLPTNVNALVLTGSANPNGTAVSGNNSVVGNAGNNILTGGSGSDTLVAGAGADTLVGGSAGSTTFVIDSSSDVIQNIKVGAEHLLSSISYVLPTNIDAMTLTGGANLVGTGNNDAFNALTANSGNDTLIAGTAVTTFYGGLGNDLFVLNNTGDVVHGLSTSNNTISSSVSYTLPSQVSTLLLTGTANLTGTAGGGASSVVGNAGHDTLVAGVGNDTLVAGSGLATLVGGAGNDVFVINNVGDVVQDTVVGESNTLVSSVSVVLPTNVSNLILTGTADLTGTANTLNDSLVGNAGNDTLTGGTGTDTLDAGAGLATLIAGAGSTTFVVDNVADVIQNASSAVSNALRTSVSYVAPANVNSLTLTGHANIVGTGNTGADTLIGASGADTLIAGTGLATLIGGTGNTTFVVNNVGDVVQDASTASANTLQSSVSYALATNVNTLVLTGTAALKGTANAGNDILTSNSGVDTLVGGAGNDTFVVNNLADVVQDTAASANNVAQASVSYALVANVNTLILTGTSALKGTANSGNDTLVSNSGVDTLIGGLGNDVFVVNNANDIVQDSLTGTNNTVQSSASYVLPTNVNTLFLLGSGNLVATANAASDVITANSGTDTLIAGASVDTLIGGTGPDTFVINNAADVVIDSYANAGNLVQSSVSYALGSGVNRLTLTGTGALTGTANSAGDTLVSNSGVDTLVGGAGNDLFIVNNSADVLLNVSTTDTVLSSVSYVLPSTFSAVTLTGTANISATGNINYSYLYGGAGQDTLIASAGVASMTGGSGNATFVVNSASDIVRDSAQGTSNTILSSATYTLPTNVDTLVLTGSLSLSATGNADASNVLTANSGSDNLTATANATTINGGAGVDRIYAGPGTNLIYAGSGGTTASPTYVYGNASGTSFYTQSTIYGGSGTDVITGGPGSDLIYAGTGVSTINSGSGSDTVYGSAGSVISDSLSGSDLLVAGAGAESITGFGADTLVAGSGADVLTGSSADTVEINAGFGNINIYGPQNIVFGAGINFSDFTASIHQVSVDSPDVVLTGDGGTLTFTDALIPINLYSYGAGSGSLNEIAPVAGEVFTFAGGAKNSLEDFILQRGSTQSQTNYQGNLITLNVGSNQTIGMVGASDSIVAAGDNNVIFGVDRDTLTGSIGVGIDPIFYVPGNNDTVYGSSIPFVSNVLVAAGNYDLLTTGGNNDHLIALGHNDTLSSTGGTGLALEVGDASTVVQVAYAGNGDTVLSSVNITAPSNIQYLELIEDGLVGTANSLGDSISAIYNNDTLIGGAGYDTLSGQGTNDVLVAGSGHEVLEVYSRPVTVVLGADPTLDTIAAFGNYTLGAGAVNLELVGGGVATGNNLADHLTALGNSGTLVAGSGADTLDAGTNYYDTLVGGAGIDVFIVGNTTDVVVDAYANTGSSLYSSVNFTLPVNVNSFTLTGTQALTATANNASDLLTANTGNDTLVAGVGQDTLVSGAGSDTFKFNSGFTSDLVTGPLSFASIVFGAGINASNLTFTPLLSAGTAPSLKVSGLGGTVTVAGGLVAGAVSTVQFGDGSTSTIKQLIAQGTLGPVTVAGSSGNLIMSAADSVSLAGGAGTDTISAWGDSDTILGGTGANVVYASGIADSLVGGSGNTTLVAAGANDTVAAGTGIQALVIKNATDVVQGPAVLGNDTVFSSVSYALPSANLARLTLTGSASLQATANTLNDVLTANSGTDTLVSGTGIDTLIGSSAGGLFVVNNSADVVQANGNQSGNAVQSYVSYVMPENTASLTLLGTGSITANGNDQAGVLTANSGADTLTAGTGVETLIGGSGADVLIAGSGGDSLVAVGFYDTLIGGAGSDTFSGASGTVIWNDSNDVVQGTSLQILSSISYRATGNTARITLTGTANLTADDGGFNAYAITGNSGNDILIGAGGTYQLISGSGIDTMYGGANGTSFTVNNAADVVVALANPSNSVLSYVSYVAPANVSSLTLMGSANLVGTGGSTSTFWLYANSGNDTLIAGTGPETLVAGSGNDLFVLNNAGDSISFGGSFGTDTVQTSLSYVMPTNIKALVLTGTANLVGQGNAAADTISANAGSDTLVAGSGNDTLIAGAGLVTMIGGAGTDMFIINNVAEVVQDATTGKVNVLQSSVSYVLPTNVNTLVLSGTSALTGTGNTGADKITANSGNDTLVAGTGVATLVGGAGSETFIVNSASDIVQDSVVGTSSTIQSSANFVLPTNVQSLVLTGTAALTGTGNTAASTVSANSGGDTLTAGTGIATLIGGSGSDTFVVNNAADVIQDAFAGSSNLIQSSVSYVLPANVNMLTFSGSGNLTGTGNSGADTITANAGNDTLIAGSGVATLVGGAGTDTFVVNNVLDVVQDATTGKSNVVQSSVSYVMPTNINTMLLTGTASIIGTGNTAAGKITANSGADTLIAGSGTTTLVGGAGNDVFVVNTTSDVVQDAVTTTSNSIQASVNFVLPANVQSLLLTGTSALTGTGNGTASTVTANSGADTLTAGSGVATLIGGAGNDTFVVNNVADVIQDSSTTAANVISSSVTYVLPTNVNTMVLTGTAALTATGNGGIDKISANSGADTLAAGTGIATLVGGAGNDTFVINNTADVVQDTSTTAVNTLRSSVSFVLPTNVNTMVLTGTAAVLATGNTAANKITANSGADTLQAGAGVATLVGGAGNDVFVVNNALDVVQDAVTTTANVIRSSVSYVLPANVQSLVLTGTAALTATGNTTASQLTANSGADTLIAGSGVATMVGGTGNDTFVVNNVGDIVQDTSTTATNVIQSSVNYVLPTNVRTLTLTGTANVTGTGNTATDTISANAGNDTLVAGAGVATLIGGAGNDTFVINNALDVVQDATVGKTNVVQSSVSYVMPTNISSLVLTGTANLTGTGNSATGKVTANSGADTLVAGAGVTTLVGGAGNDTFVVNNVADVIQDSVTTTLNIIQSSVNFVLPANVQQLLLTGTAALTGTGAAATGLIVANSGADTLTGGTGVAVLQGGAGSDTLTDTAGQGALVGGSGSDTMTGGTHKTFFAAGKISDSITTGATNNVVAVNKGDGATTIAPTTGAVNVLSLGGGIDTESLKFTKSGNNLVLTDGVAGDSITFTGWYVGASSQTFTKLQVIELASATYNTPTTDALRNQAIEEFNFTSLVTQFNTAGSPANWSLSTGMPSAQLASSGTSAYGGDLAYYYGLNNNLTSLNLSAAQSTLTNASFATATQTIDAWAGISGGPVHLNLKTPVFAATPNLTAPIVPRSALGAEPTSAQATVRVATVPQATGMVVHRSDDYPALPSDAVTSELSYVSGAVMARYAPDFANNAVAIGSKWAAMHSYFDAGESSGSAPGLGNGAGSFEDHVSSESALSLVVPHAVMSTRRPPNARTLDSRS